MTDLEIFQLEEMPVRGLVWVLSQSTAHWLTLRRVSQYATRVDQQCTTS